jgi:NAD(P)-dependent dehydrogenase (short-subunit alcohol dehydrogenase family)
MEIEEKSVSDNVMVVTGASAGIGRATAVELARRGGTVALLARGRQGLEGARRDVEAAGARALIYPVDVADWQAVDSAANAIEAEAGPIDLWVNAAMATVFCPVDRIDPADFRRATEVTYLGSVHGTLAALHRMGPRDRGVIVQVGSALAYRGIPLQAAYCGAKFALRGFTDALQAELLHTGSCVRHCTAHIAAFNTPQFDWSRSCMTQRAQPVPPVYQPEVAARAIAWLAEHPRREMWIGYPAARAIVAARWLPAGWIDRFLAQQGFESQLTGERELPGRPENLYSPVDEDRGSHGRFDLCAKPRSTQAWLTRRKLSASALIAGLAAYTLSRNGKARR